MTEFQELQAWLNSPRDFDRGLMLYIAYFNDEQVRLQLERHRSQGKLFEIIRARYYELKEEDTTPKSPKGDFEQPTATTPGVEHQLPQEMLDRWGEMKTEQERWHTELSLILEKPVQAESDRIHCAGLAELIVKREEELMGLGSAMNHYREHGIAPKGFKLHTPKPRSKRVKPLGKMNDAEQLLKLVNSIRPQLSKLTRKIRLKKEELPGLAGKALDKANSQLTEWELQLEGLEKQRKEIESKNE